MKKGNGVVSGDRISVCHSAFAFPGLNSLLRQVGHYKRVLLVIVILFSTKKVIVENIR